MKRLLKQLPLGIQIALIIMLAISLIVILIGCASSDRHAVMRDAINRGVNNGIKNAQPAFTYEDDGWRRLPCGRCDYNELTEAARVSRACPKHSHLLR